MSNYFHIVLFPIIMLVYPGLGVVLGMLWEMSKRYDTEKSEKNGEAVLIFLFVMYSIAFGVHCAVVKADMVAVIYLAVGWAVLGFLTQAAGGYLYPLLGTVRGKWASRIIITSLLVFHLGAWYHIAKHLEGM